VIQLLALAAEDGWAFVQSGERILLLRPPYGKRRHPVVDEDTVARAVAAEGFEAADQIFPDWHAVFAFLEERFLAGREPLPAALAPDAVELILWHAPPASVEAFLDRIEREFLPGRHWDAANRLLARFLAVDAPAVNALKSRAADLLVRCQEMRSAESQKWRWLAERAQAPLTAARYGSEAVRVHAEQIRQSGFFPAHC
jgi:hypothetical protein